MRGELWTIECTEFHGPERSGNAEAVAEVLRRSDGINGAKVSVIHGDEASTVYYGEYARRIDRAEGKREIPRGLREDLASIRELGDDRGRRVFLTARMVRRPTPDIGAPEWNLSNVDGVYTLQVGAYESTPERPDFKRAAVEHVALLRENGYEAYFHHDRAVSVVTVGVFGNDAVVNRDGNVDYSAEVRALQRKENFKYNLTNGAVWHAIVDGQKAPVRSLLVRIPKTRESTP